MKIILSRHGKPAIKIWGGLPAYRMGEWIEAYNNSGLEAESKPPKAAIQAATSCNVIVCSHLQRSVESAELLRVSKPIIKKPGFQEMELPFTDWKYPRLSPCIWIMTFRLLWFLGYSKHCVSFRMERKRAKSAAEHLVALAREYDSIMFVGHGMLNRFIVRNLLTTGWVGPRSPGNTFFWQHGVYTRGQVSP